MFRVILHVDMDAFYASIEQRDRPALRGKPVIVGSPPYQRGVVCAASYEARKFGVRSAMPSSTAARLCPNGIFVPVQMQKYKAVSQQVMEVLASTGAAVEPMSIDEAYLDLTEVILAECGGDLDPDKALQLSLPVARYIKNSIKAATSVTASIGVAANKLLAKLGSDFQKPDGLTLVPEKQKIEFLRPLSIRALHGVGKVTEQGLNKAGVHTVADLQDYPGDLRALVGSFGSRLRDFSFGRDDRPLELGDDIKSISSEETFPRDTDNRRLLNASLKTQAQDVAAKLIRKQLAAQTVQVKLRYGDFTTLTRQITVDEPVAEASEIYRLACFLLAREKLVSRPLRLLGLGVSNLDLPGSRQLGLWA